MDTGEVANVYPDISSKLSRRNLGYYKTDSVEFYPSTGKESWSQKLNRFAMEHYQASPIMAEAMHSKTQSQTEV